MLGQLYATTGRLAEATVEYENLAGRQPKSIAPRTAVGLLLHMQNRLAEARAQYERALEIDSHAGVAANNLAWIYANGDGNLDVALKLAQTAKAQIPSSHEVDDTLGWVYYKKGLSTLAIAAFKQSTAAAPNNATYLYHLGLAYAQNGEKPRARETLERALRVGGAFEGADEAKRVLRSVQS